MAKFKKSKKIYPGLRNGALTVVEETDGRTSQGYIEWRCKCDCGNEYIGNSGTLLHVVHGADRSVKSCGCQIYCRYKDEVIGKIFAEVKVLRYLRSERRSWKTSTNKDGYKKNKNIKKKDYRWDHIFECECLFENDDGIRCGKIFERSGSRLHENPMTKTCGCGNKAKGKLRYNCANYKDFPGNFFTKIKHNARSNNRAFKLTIEYMWRRWEKQGGKEGGHPARCAISGLEIQFADINAEDRSRYTYHNTTASPDRTNNDKDYIKRNFQWCHKVINMMRGKLSIGRFRYMCCYVAAYCIEHHPKYGVESELYTQLMSFINENTKLKRVSPPDWFNQDEVNKESKDEEIYNIKRNA